MSDARSLMRAAAIAAISASTTTNAAERVGSVLPWFDLAQTLAAEVAIFGHLTRHDAPAAHQHSARIMSELYESIGN